MRTVPGIGMQGSQVGPSTRILCECGSALEELPAGKRAVLHTSVPVGIGKMHPATCKVCGKVTKILVVDDG